MSIAHQPTRTIHSRTECGNHIHCTVTTLNDGAFLVLPAVNGKDQEAFTVQNEAELDLVVEVMAELGSVLDDLSIGWMSGNPYPIFKSPPVVAPRV